tara:strand:- start:288 stop:461 length:174 start_codon:yes stop_codon:yes gene_type:complete
MDRDKEADDDSSCSIVLDSVTLINFLPVNENMLRGVEPQPNFAGVSDAADHDLNVTI